MRLLWYNLADAMTITGNAANNYPVSNVLDWQAAKAWRAPSANDSLYLDAGANNTVTATCIGIVRHNWGANGTYLIQANDSNNWTAPALNQTITRAADMIVQTFNNTTQRYWRIGVDDNANPDGYVKIGYLFLGEYYQFTDQPSKDFPIAFEDSSSSWTSKTGQDFTNAGAVRRQWSFQWPYVTNNDRISIDAIYDYCKKARPMIVVPVENNTAEIPPVFAKLNEPPTWNHIIAFKWNLALSFKEQL